MGLIIYGKKKLCKQQKIFVIDDLKKNIHYCDLYLNYHHNFFRKKDERLLIKKNVKIMKGLNLTLLGNQLSKIKKILIKKEINIKYFFTWGMLIKIILTLRF